jgi:hypothetical protein
MRLDNIVALCVGRGWRLLLVLLLVDGAAGGREALAISVAPDPTHVYWTENSRPFGGALLRRMPLGGGPAVDLFSDDDMLVSDMEIDSSAQKIYWVAYDDGLVKIQRRNLNGGGAEDLYAHSEAPPHFIDNVSLDLGAGKMYWTETDIDTNTYLIRRANLDGSGIQDVRAAAGRAIELVLDLPRGQMFWQDFPTAGAGNPSLRRANLDGSGYQSVAQPFGLFSMDIDSLTQRLYMTYYGGDWVMRSGFNGSYTTIYDQSNGVENGPLDLEVDPQGQFLYWVNEISGSIQRAQVQPFSSTPVTLIAGLNNPTVIALGVIPEPGCSLLASIAVGVVGVSIRGRRRE